MATYKIPPVSTLTTLTTAERAGVLDHLFEPCVPLHTLSVELLKEKTFSSYDSLIARIAVQLMDLAGSTSTSDTKWLEAILEAHPRLGQKKVDSAQSRAEQAQLSSSDPLQEEKLFKLNDEYEQTFPGLRYVVFVNGRTRPTIMEDMRLRIDRGDIRMERAEAIKAMCDIAADRARKLNAET